MKQIILFLIIVFLALPGWANSWENLQSEKEKIEAELKLYPNPVKNSQVTISLETKSFVEVRVISITGKEIIKKMYDFPLRKTVLRLNDVPNGIYILQLKTDDDKLIAKKLLVSKE